MMRLGICRSIITLATVLVTTGVSVAQMPTPSEVDRAYLALDERSRDVVETYLRTDCEIGEVGAALKAVVQIGAVLKPYLVAVEREGPRSAILNEFRRDLDNTWRAREEYLKTSDAKDLGKESFEMMRAITKGQYFKDQSEALRAKYRERAALALRAIAGGSRP